MLSEAEASRLRLRQLPRRESASFLDEPWQRSFNRIEFSGIHFEIRIKTDEIRLHFCKVRRAANLSMVRFGFSSLG